MGATFSDPGPPLTAADLTADRNGLGFPLPTVYAEWLIQVNGGTPTLRSFSTVTGKRLKIERFIGLRTDAAAVADNAQALYRHLVSALGLPAQYLPVARGPGSELFFLDVRPADDGEVWHWNMFGDTYADEVPYGRFVRVAAGFASLLAALGSK